MSLFVDSFFFCVAEALERLISLSFYGGNGAQDISEHFR